MPSSLLFSYYTSRVYPAGCCAPCRAGFGTVRFAYAKAMARFSHNLVLCSCSARIRAKFCGNKKGASRCIYPNEALQSLRTINANDPRPKRAVAPGHATNDRPSGRLQQTEARQNVACLRERSPCPRSCEICRFRLEGKSKNSFTLQKLI